MKVASFRFSLFPLSRLLVFLVAATLFITQAHAQLVEIPDTNLESAIRETLNSPDNTAITQQEMLQLTDFAILDSSIADLTGLEYATNLEVLNLVNNQITDITSLANLTNLTHLYLGDNALQTIEPLAGLINLRVLDLYNTGVKDITPLANLTALESLGLVRNMIADISPLVGLKNLKRLWLAENPIQDFTPLLELEGVELDLDIDFSRLDQLNLVVTTPDSNLEREIRETLVLPDGVPLTQLEMLRLTELQASQRDITDLTGLQYATNLEYLSLWGNQIKDITPLAKLTKLKDLDLAYNAVESVEPLARLINLQRLNLTFNRVQDITPLANLAHLQRLYIRVNLVTNITPLQGLNLIEFEYDEICDIPPILPPVGERIENRGFPSIGASGAEHAIYGVDHLTPDQRAALHDLEAGVWFPSIHWDQTPAEPYEGLSTSLAANLSRARETHRRQLDLNPNRIFLLGVDWRSYFTDEALPPGSDFWLKNENGEIVRSPTGSPQLNFFKSEVQDLIAKRIVAVERCGLYDGVMLDQFADHGAFGRQHHEFGTEEETIQSVLNIFRAVRSQVRKDFLILINANRTKATRYTEYVNGSFMEAGQAFTHSEFQKIESALSWNEQHLRSPQMNCLQGEGTPEEPPDSPNNRRWMRVWTTLSLTHSDGYVLYTDGWSSIKVCEECPYPWGQLRHIWYPFWDADLGRPVGPKAQLYQNIDGLFIREFTNGWAVYNRSGDAQTITLPASATPVSDRGNNAASLTHLLPDLDGEMYLKAKNPADVNGDWVVDVLDLVQVANGLGEATPDPNGDGMVNILDLVFVAQQFSQ